MHEKTRTSGGGTAAQGTYGVYETRGVEASDMEHDSEMDSGSGWLN